MKYIKLFEYRMFEYEDEFKPDYFILNGNNETMAKVIGYDSHDDLFPYKVQFTNGAIVWYSGDNFKRKMTEEEIIEFEDEFELNKNVSKYNL